MRTKRDAAEKKLADDAKLLRLWRKHHRDELNLVLAGPHGAVLGELFRMFKNLQHVQPAQLIGFTRSIDWSSIAYDIRLAVVHELNTAIIALREKHGLAPIEDNLPDEPDTPFHVIRAIMLSTSRPREGAHRGEARPEKQSSQ
jgi:hypothetical protein